MFQPPPRVYLGEHASSPIAAIEHRFRDTLANGKDTTLCGFKLPSWQRPFVWTEKQQLDFMESLWSGYDVGTYTYNQTEDYDSPYDELLIDGQQRVTTLGKYFRNEISVYGGTWSEVDPASRRRFLMTTHFHCYVTKSEDEQYLRQYYNRMNFSGTPHKESERA